MPHLGSLILLLAVTPAIMFAVHAVVHRALCLLFFVNSGRKPNGHFSALVALAGTFALVCGTVWSLGIIDTSGVATIACALAYITVVYGALAILYLDVVNIAETSLHMHVLLELAWYGGVPVTDLLERYGADRMLGSRLERLSALGQLRIVDGRCYIGKRSTLYLASGIDIWRLVLGLPTSPPASANEPVTP
jgi:hypothetical protein